MDAAQRSAGKWACMIRCGWELGLSHGPANAGRYCGVHCVDNAHAHVVNCRWNSARPRTVFAKKEQYLADRRAFKGAMTTEYIEKNVEAQHRDAVQRHIAALR